MPIATAPQSQRLLSVADTAKGAHKLCKIITQKVIKHNILSKDSYIVLSAQSVFGTSLNLVEPVQV